MDPRIQNERKHFDRLASELGHVWWGHLTQAGQHRIERRARVAGRFAGLSPGKTILEPGSGSGEFTEKLAKSGATICSVELSPPQMAIAKRRLGGLPNVCLTVGDAGRLDFREGAFDAVVGLSVLHHLDLNRVLPEFLRVLKPGGRMFFSEPNMLNPQVFLERNVKWIGRRLQNSPDETAFVRWPLTRTLAAAGFVHVEVVPVDFLHPALPGFTLGLMSRINRVLERLPLIREAAGSLFVFAAKPDAAPSDRDQSTCR